MNDHTDTAQHGQQFPQRKDSAQPASNAPSFGEQPSGNRAGMDSPRTNFPRTDVPRILVADENADVRTQIQRLLEPYYEVITVADGQAALDAFYQRPPDLVLSDIALSRLDGIELLRTLKSRLGAVSVPVVLLADQPIEEIGIDVSAIGADDYLIKPSVADELLIRVQKQLDQVRVRRQADIDLRTIIAHAPFAISVLRGANFVVEMANEWQLTMWGRSAEQVLNKPFFEAFPEAGKQDFEDYLTTVLTTGETATFSELPVTFSTSNGPNRTAYFSCAIQPLRDASGGIYGVMTVASDVTEIVLARQMVADNANRLQALFEQAPVGVVAMGPGPDLIIEMANLFYCELVGRTADELIGKPMMVAMPELAGQGFDFLLLKVMETGTPYVSRETPVQLVRDGQPETVYVDFVYQPRREADRYAEAGKITGVVVIVTDITQAVRMRQRVEANERTLNAMIRQTPLGVAILRRPNFVIERANPAVCRMWDRTLEQATGRPLFEVLPETAGQGFEELLTGVYESGIAFEGRELPATIERNGRLEIIYFDFVYEPLLEVDGTIERIMVVGTDATESRKARLIIEESEAHYRELAIELEERVKCRTQELERSNLDLMQFASVASHDLREPLRKVQTFGTRLEEMLAGRLNEEEADLFRRLVNATARMHTLISDVLRLSILSDQTSSFEPVDLNAVVSQISDDLELIIRERNAELTMAPLPTVLAAPGQMHQIFQNLISNALKFNTNAVPAIHIEPVPLTDTVASELELPTREYTVIAVTDNGIGFEQKYEDKIFGMFQRLHGRSQYMGTGIGLTIVKKIVENHRGYIDVQSEPGRGTTFRVALPVS